MDAAYDHFIEALEAAGCQVPHRRPGHAMAQCPAHDDRVPSLSVSEGNDGRVLIRCHAGCSAEEVVQRLGLTLRDLFADGRDAALVDAATNGSRQPGVEAAANAAGTLSAPDLPGLRVLDVRRMVAEAPPPVPWVIEGLAVEGALTLISGKEGEGKSLLSMSLAAGVALGEEVAGLSCAQRRVLIVDAENGEREIHRRVRTLGLPSTGVTLVEADGFHLGRDLSGLSTLVEEVGCGLVVLDSFRSLWPGSDENDSAAVTAVLDPLRSLLRRHGAAGVLLHHISRAGNDYRGTSAIGAAIEMGFRLSRAADDPEARDRRRLRCFKCRPAPEPPDRWLRLHVERGQVFVDTAEAFESPETERPSALPRAELAPEMLAAAATPTTWPDLARAIGREPKDGTARRLRDDLLVTGELVKGANGSLRVPHTVAPPDSAARSHFSEGCHGATPPKGGEGGGTRARPDERGEPPMSG